MSYTPRNTAQADADRTFRQLGGQVVALRVDWANRLGSIHAALVLQQLLFEARHHATVDGWFFVTADDMQEHTAVASRAYHTARGILTDAGIIETKRAGVPAKTYIRFHWAKFGEWLREVDDGDSSMPADLDSATAESSLDDRSNKTLREAELLRESNENTKRDNLADEPPAPPSRKHSPTHQIIQAFCDAMGIERLVAYNKAGAQAKQLAAAGITPSDIPEIVEWLLADPFWSEKGIDLGIVMSQADKWPGRRHKQASRPLTQEELREHVIGDWKYGVYPIGFEGMQRWRADCEQGTLPQLDGSR